MMTYKQYQMLNESFVGTFASVLARPVTVGGVVGGVGASELALEEAKKRYMKKFMLGDEEGDGEGEDKEPKKSNKGGNPFAGKKADGKGAPVKGDDDLGDDDDDDMDGDDLGHDDDGDMDGDDDLGDDDDMDGDDLGHDDDGMGHDDLDGDDDMGDDDDMGHDDMGGDDALGGDLGHDDMGGDDMGHDDMGMGGDDMGMGGAHGGSAKGLVCHSCGHHEPDKNAKFCKMCGKGMSKFMKKHMSKGDCGDKKLPPWLKGKEKVADKVEDKGKKVVGKKKKSLKEQYKTAALKNFDKRFFDSLTNMLGDPKQRHAGGWKPYHEDALLAPKNSDGTQTPGPGEVGYAPTGRIGDVWGNDYQESAKKK